MPTKGTYSALQSLKGLGDGVTEDVKYWNNDGYERRFEEREIAKIEQEKVANEQKAKQKNWDDWIKPLSNYDSKSTSLNEVQGFAIKQAEEEMLKEVRVLNDPKASDEQKMRSKLRLGNLAKTPENLKKFTDHLTAENNAYMKAKEDLSGWDDLDYEKRFRDGYAGVKVGFDANGNPLVGYEDTDGDNMLDLVDFSKIQSVQPTTNFMRRSNLDGIATELATNIGTNDITTDKNFTSRQIKEVKTAELKTAVTNLMQDKNGKPTEVALSALREMGYDYKNPKKEEFDKVIESVYQNALAKTDKTDSTKRDNSGSLARQKYNDDKDEVKQEITTSSPTKETFPNYKGISTGKAISVSGAKKVGSVKTETWDNGEEEWVNKTRKVKGVDGKEVTETIKVKNPKYKGNKGEELTDVTPQAYTVDDKGRVIASVYYEIGSKASASQISDLEYYLQEAKTDEDKKYYQEQLEDAKNGVKKTTKDIIVPEDRLDEFARKSGLKNGEELKETIKNKEEEYDWTK